MFGNMGKMLRMAAEMKTRLPEVQQQLAVSEYSTEAGGGAVRATVNGKLQLVDLQIDATVLQDGKMDGELLADLIKAAVSAAQEKAATAAAEAMKELTGGMDVPGLDGLLG
jgi:nucleoid-associated protein EbfC